MMIAFFVLEMSVFKDVLRASHHYIPVRMCHRRYKFFLQNSSSIKGIVYLNHCYNIGMMMQSNLVVQTCILDVIELTFNSSKIYVILSMVIKFLSFFIVFFRYYLPWLLVMFSGRIKGRFTRSFLKNGK